MKIENVITFTKQFNKEFGSKIKISNKNIPLLLNMFYEYIGQTFKTSDVYNEILGRIVELEEQLKNTLTDEQQDLFDKWDIYKEELNQYTSERSFIYGVCLDKEYTTEKRARNKLKDEQNSNDNFFYNYIDSIMQFIEDNRFNIWSKRKDYKEITDKMRAIKNKYPNVRTFVDDRQVVDLTKEELKAVLEYISLDDDIERLEKIETFKLGIKEGISF